MRQPSVKLNKFKQKFLRLPKVRPTVSLLGNSLLVNLAVFCTFGALISAFSFSVNMGSLFLIWLLTSVAVSILAMIYRGKSFLMLVPPVALLLIFRATEIIEGAKWVLYVITSIFNDWISVTVLFQWDNGLIRTPEDPTVFFAAAGMVLTFLLAFAICMRRSLLLTILFTTPIVFLTFIITDYQPDIFYLIGLIAVYLTLLISSAFSPDDFFRRGFLFLPVFAVATVLIILAYMIAPHGTYVRSTQISMLGNRLRYAAAQMERFGSLWQAPAGGVGGENSWLGSRDGELWQFNTNNVSVADAEGRILTDQSLLEITATEPGTFYLRGYSMQLFDGRTWSVSNEVSQNVDIEVIWPSIVTNNMRDYLFPTTIHVDVAQVMPTFITEFYSMHRQYDVPAVVEMRITRTGDTTPDITYQPYYGPAFIESSNTLDATGIFYYLDGSIHRLFEMIDEEIMVYRDFQFMYEDLFLPEDQWVDAGSYTIYPNPELSDALAEYTKLLNSTGVYREIYPDTAQGLRHLAIDAGIDISADRVAVADAIASLIMASGRYTLTPGTIPQDEDFALYFLQTSQEGYCIHFATAAVLMLRSLDIPARFVSGYVVTVSQDEVGSSVVITDRNAHAWVEVYYEDVGWLYLEVTPASSSSVIPGPRPHSPESQPINTPVPPTPEVPNEVDIPQETPPPSIDNERSPSGLDDVDVLPDEWKSPTWAVNLVIALAIIALCAAFLLVRRHVLNRQRIYQFGQKNTNEAVICMWRYVVRLSRQESVPASEIEELALKARFSQHRILEEERQSMVKYAQMLAFEVYNGKDGLGRLWLKYIRALY